MKEYIAAAWQIIKADLIGSPVVPSGFVDPANGSARIASMLNTILILACVIATVYVMYSGILYAISAGDPSKIKQAQATWNYALMGLIVAYSSMAILRIVGGMLGIQNWDLPL